MVNIVLTEVIFSKNDIQGVIEESYNKSNLYFLYLLAHVGGSITK